MKILLVNPPKKNEIFGNNPQLIENVRGFNPPLGILYIAGYLLENSSHTVFAVDAQVEELDYEQLKISMSKNGPYDVIGLTVMTFTIIDVMLTVRLIKSLWPDVTVVLGGPHASIYPRETVALGGVDYAIVGEGEITFLELLNAIENNKSPENIAGLAFKKAGKYIQTTTRPPLEELDSLAEPARHLVPYEKYFSILFKGRPVTSIFTSRGCPFRCTFCDRPHMGKKFRFRSAKAVLKEMKNCLEMGIQEFLFYDDTFTVNRERVMELCDLIIREKMYVTWDVRAHVNTIDKAMLEKMKKAGCQAIHYGVESGSERILKSIEKGITKKKARDVFQITKESGIKTLAYFIIGFPSETESEIQGTIDFAIELDPDYLHLTKLCPFPSTKIYLDALSSNVFTDDLWKKFAENPNPEFKPPICKGKFSEDDLNGWIKKGYKKFYLRRKYIFKQLMNIKNISDLKRKMIAGRKVMTM